ncbi:MAG: hypothetical protein LBH84_02330 [Prevotellaceae bacterium]|nr:hypothetical protein [Prevotellaceae bacterium]
MKTYSILISPEAKADVEDFFKHICFVYKQPLQAVRNRIDLYQALEGLSFYADSIAVSQSNYIQSRFGPAARCINHKKMTVIYVVYGDYVYVKRVVHSALIH